MLRQMTSGARGCTQITGPKVADSAGADPQVLGLYRTVRDVPGSAGMNAVEDPPHRTSSAPSTSAPASEPAAARSAWASGRSPAARHDRQHHLSRWETGGRDGRARPSSRRSPTSSAASGWTSTPTSSTRTATWCSRDRDRRAHPDRARRRRPVARGRPDPPSAPLAARAAPDAGHAGADRPQHRPPADRQRRASRLTAPVAMGDPAPIPPGPRPDTAAHQTSPRDVDGEHQSPIRTPIGWVAPRPALEDQDAPASSPPPTKLRAAGAAP